MIIDFIKILSPFTPFVCEEMHQHYTGKETLAYEPWPEYDETKLIVDEVEVVVQVNGKLRGRVNVALDSDEETVKELALKLPTVINQTKGKTIRKIIYIPNKLMNIVAK